MKSIDIRVNSNDKLDLFYFASILLANFDKESYANLREDVNCEFEFYWDKEIPQIRKIQIGCSNSVVADYIKDSVNEKLKAIKGAVYSKEKYQTDSLIKKIKKYCVPREDDQFYQMGNANPILYTLDCLPPFQAKESMHLGYEPRIMTLVMALVGVKIPLQVAKHILTRLEQELYG